MHFFKIYCKYRMTQPHFPRALTKKIMGWECVANGKKKKRMEELKGRGERNQKRLKKKQRNKKLCQWVMEVGIFSGTCGTH